LKFDRGQIRNCGSRIGCSSMFTEGKMMNEFGTRLILVTWYLMNICVS